MGEYNPDDREIKYRKKRVPIPQAHPQPQMTVICIVLNKSPHTGSHSTAKNVNNTSHILVIPLDSD